MTGILSIQRAKQALIVLLVIALAFTSVLLIRDSQVEAQQDPFEALLTIAQVDVICTHRSTGVDRVRESASLGSILEALGIFPPDAPYPPVDLEEFLDGCTRYETMRISLSLNGDLILDLAEESGGIPPFPSN